MGRVWDVCGYEPDPPDYDDSDRYDSGAERTCNPTLGDPCGECSACGGEDDDDAINPHIQRAIDALDAIRTDWAGVEVTPDGTIMVVPYWAPECVDPDGRPIGTARTHIDQWERVTEALEGVGWEPQSMADLHIGRLLAIAAGRMSEGGPVVFCYVGADDGEGGEE